MQVGRIGGWTQEARQKYPFALFVASGKVFFPLVTVPYLTRVLGPDIYAVRAYVMAAMSLFLMFLEYGFNASGAKTIAEASSRDLIGREVTSIAMARILLCITGVVPLIFVTF